VSVRIVANWWSLAIRGVAGIIFGIACFAFSGVAGLLLVLLLAAYLMIDGIFAAIGGALVRSWWLLAEGVLGIVAGILALFFPTITALALVLLVAAWAILTGIAELGAAVLLRRVIANEWLLGVTGIVSLALGIALALNPYAGLVTIVWLIGGYAFVFGVLCLALAIRMRGTNATFVVTGS
jgi:uncharacterized membrane protein HdeD (DUF308 family)